MTKIKFSTQNISVIYNELDMVSSNIQEAINYANSIYIPNKFRQEDVVNAINTLGASKKFIAKTVNWIQRLKQNYQNITDESTVRIAKIDDKILTEKGLIIK